MLRLRCILILLVAFQPLMRADERVAPSKPSWASEMAKDAFGTWADLQVAGVTQRFRWIPPGTFQMGSPPDEQAAAIQAGTSPDWVEPEVQHQVTVTQGFWLADTACTQECWKAITGSNPAHFNLSMQHPVDQISWDDCQLFLTRLNAAVPGGRFRLPTEAQWEYACRAGTTTAFNCGMTITPDQVNYDGRHPFGGAAMGLHRAETVAVKSFPPNAWGLYEMHGNVSQWCADWWGNLSRDPARDPTGPTTGSLRVDRGGNASSGAALCRSALRDGHAPSNRNYDHGLRIAAPAEP